MMGVAPPGQLAGSAPSFGGGQMVSLYAGLPLIGDRAYNPGYREHAAGAPIPFPRQALHAEVLTLEHPGTLGKQMTWKAEMPKDLRQLEAALRAG